MNNRFIVALGGTYPSAELMRIPARDIGTREAQVDQFIHYLQRLSPTQRLRGAGVLCGEFLALKTVTLAALSRNP
ncbi:MAG: hypothetical protein JO069_00850 [Verrucomicrobia bacterium]|nr:hypothetical protein [Verrucomicrobiota bacterium]